MARDEIRPLTSLRTIAAGLVFFHHFSGIPYGTVVATPWLALAVEGHVGVSIFFGLSGFLITLRYLPTMAAERFSWREYFGKRVARIHPLYFTVLLLSLLMTGTPFFGSHAVVNWTLTQGLFDEWKFSGIPTGWTLTVEEAFYAVAPVMLISSRWMAARVRSTMLGAMLTLCGWVVGFLVVGEGLVRFAGATSLSTVGGFMATELHMLIYTVFGRMFDFAAGVFMAALYIERRSTLWLGVLSRLGATVMITMGLFGVGMCMWTMNQRGGVFIAWRLEYAIAALTAFIILGLTCPGTPYHWALSWQPLVYLGRISYALYLMQMTPLMHQVVRPLVNPAYPHVPLALYVVASLVSAVLYELVERPARQGVLRLVTRPSTSDPIFGPDVVPCP